MYLNLKDRKAINNGYVGSVGLMLLQEHDLYSQQLFINNRKPELQQQSTTDGVGSLPQNGAVHVTDNNGSLVWNPSLYEQLGKFGAQELNPQNQDLNNKGKSGGNLTLAGIGAGLAVADNIDTGDPRGLWDTMDPVYHLAGDKESKVGNGLSDAGVALTKTGLLSGNFYLAAAGGAVKVLGGLTNALFGTSASAERERRLRKAAFEDLLKKQGRYETQMGALMLNKFDQKYGYLNDQKLFKAAKGKESVNPITGATDETFTVNTAYGKVKGKQDAWVSKGEVIKAPSGAMYKVPAGKNDTARAYVGDKGTVFSEEVINPETGRPIAEDVPTYAAIGQLDRLEQNLAIGREIQNMRTKQNKNVRKFALGKEVLGALSKAFDGNMVTLGNAMANAREQYRDSLEPIYRPDVYEGNRYEMPALQTLNSLRLDYYPVARLNLEAEARSRNNIARSGGLSAGQKAMLYRGLNYDTQRNNANALFNNMIQNNAYRQAAALAAIQLGQDEARGRLQANMFTEEALAKAHAAAIQQKNMSMFNAQNALEQFYANRFKKYQYDRAMNLYEQQRADDERQREYERNKNLAKEPETSPEIETTYPGGPVAPLMTYPDDVSPQQLNGTVLIPGWPLLVEYDPRMQYFGNGATSQQVDAPVVRTPATQTPVVDENNNTAQVGAVRHAAAKKRGGAKPSNRKSNVSLVGDDFMMAKPKENKIAQYSFQVPDITDRFPNASQEAKNRRPYREKPGRVAATTNRQALSRLAERIMLGKKEYERRYGKD